MLTSWRRSVSRLRKLAKGQDCQIRIPSVCNFNNETTVLCHLNGSGTGTKYGNAEPAEDMFGAWGCSACHDAVDKRNNNHNHNYHMIMLWFYDGVIRTQKHLIKMGEICLKK